MGRRWAAAGGGLLLVVLSVGSVFIIGMRRKTPFVLDAVRRFNRGVGNPHQMKTAGTAGAYASVVQHVGRNSGRQFETPVVAETMMDGFVIALPYGSQADWVKNVLKSGSATIVHEGGTYFVHQPEVVATADVLAYFPEKDRRNLFPVPRGPLSPRLPRGDAWRVRSPPNGVSIDPPRCRDCGPTGSEWVSRLRTARREDDHRST